MLVEFKYGYLLVNVEFSVKQGVRLVVYWNIFSLYEVAGVSSYFECFINVDIHF